MAGTSVVGTNQPGFFTSGSFTLDPASIAAASEGTETVPVPEARVGDVVHVTPRTALDEGIILSYAWVSASGTISVTLFNHTAGAIDVASATWDYVLIRGASGRAS
jgi:hypothetical protein